jgi:hypothetical protein
MIITVWPKSFLIITVWPEVLQRPKMYQESPKIEAFLKILFKYIFKFILDFFQKRKQN